MVYNTEGDINSEDLNSLLNRKTSLGSKGSHRVVRDVKADRDSLYKMLTSLGLKGSNRVVSDKTSDLDNGNSVMSDVNIVHQYNKTILWSRRKSKRGLTGGKTLVSRAAKKQGLSALGRVNYKTYIVGAETAVLPVVVLASGKNYVQ